ncbi:MAG TPA: 3-hydroxyacyl-CoA dehydrogenase NAD-binding domain-containing protein [Roseiflexaceae bacterium]|nr:3-hydroxyacyl-CoA dehydrogenase NAD-binding domain-containing protein [Roseiflexaceae bacterium]
MNPNQIAVLGCGTMGAGIAQAALAAGYAVMLYDVSAPALERARERIAAGLSKQGHTAAIERLGPATALEQIAGAALAIEAAPEQLDLKRELFAKAGAICPAPAVLASNTSSLPIAALAAAAPDPQRVAGLHFFNPVHRMALVEVVRATATDDTTIAALLAFVERLGKTAVQTRDTPGFVVNRVARPFYGEALRLLGEDMAKPAAIDAALEQAGGFPLGPFALMDLIGIDVNLAVTRSIYEQSFGEPRFRAHPIQLQMVLAGNLGRKSGRGFYEYDGQEMGAGGRRSPESGDIAAAPTPNTQPPTAGSVLFSSGTWAPGVAELCASAGLTVADQLPYTADPSLRAAFVVAGRGESAADQLMILDRQLPADTPIFAQCADTCACDLAALLRYPERLVGFDGLWTRGAITLVATPVLAAAVREQADTLVRGLGRAPIWIADAPALIVPRVVAMLANEAAFALGEGVADAATIDTAMRLGANHPVGPLARAAELGYDKIVALLDHLHAEYGEERYRVAPALRRAARVGRM